MISIAQPKPTTCWFCEKPRSATARAKQGRAVCASCEGFMRQGVICIGVSVALPSDTIIDKIYRDGNWAIISCDEYERRFRSAVPPQRFAFVTPEAWARAYLPRFRKHGASHGDNTNPSDPSIVPEDLDALMDDDVTEEAMQ